MLTLSEGAVDAMANTFAAMAEGGSLRILGGSTVLAELRLGSPAFAPADGGILRASTLSGDMGARATGDADKYQIVAADGAALCDGDVGVVGSGAALELVGSTRISQGQPVICTEFVMVARR